VTDTIVSYPCVVFALARESMAFRSRIPSWRRIREAPCRAWLAGPPRRTLLVVETGLGREPMAAGVGWALSEPRIGTALYRPPFLILAGFSGALRPGQAAGDLVLATCVVDEHGARWPVTWPPQAAPARAGVTVLTVDSLVTEPAVKRELGIRYAAVAADMESSAAASLCHERGLPFGCFRAISDDADMRLSPDLVDLLRAGRPRLRTLLAAIARRPRIVGELLILARNTRTAAGRLAAMLEQLLADEPAGGEAG
jgi:adenosylhomocysteine nucleosidase